MTKKAPKSNLTTLPLDSIIGGDSIEALNALPERSRFS